MNQQNTAGDPFLVGLGSDFNFAPYIIPPAISTPGPCDKCGSWPFGPTKQTVGFFIPEQEAYGDK